MNGKQNKRAEKRIWRFLCTIFFAVSLAVLLCMLEKADIYGVSMSPSLEDGDCVLVEKFSYLIGKPKRFDVVVFQYRSEEKRFYAKRIIGLPGETVQILDGEIYINGIKLEEDKEREKILEPGRAKEPVILGEDEYFLLGDNRNNSADSRHSDIGNVKRKAFAGKVLFKLSKKGKKNDSPPDPASREEQ